MTLLPMLALAALVVFVPALFLFATVQGMHRRHERVAAWDEAALRLGLSLRGRASPGWRGLRTRFRDMYGAWKGVPVVVRIETVQVAHRDDDRELGSGQTFREHRFTRVEASVTPALALGLVVENRGFVGETPGDLDSLFRPADPVVASRCVARALQPRGAQQLLASPLLQERLRELARLDTSFRLTDDCVTFAREELQTDPAVLAERLDAAVDLAQRLTGARRDMEGVDVERAMGEAFHAAADALGLAHDDTRVLLRGRLRGVHLEVEAGHHEHRECTVFRTSFDRPLGVGLRVRRRSAGLGDLLSGLTGGHWHADDGSFEDVFEVDGQPREAVRALLTPKVRDSLLQLATLATALTVRDDHLGIRVDRWITEADELVAAAHVVAMAGASLLGEARLNVVGPFRSRPG